MITVGGTICGPQPPLAVTPANRVLTTHFERDTVGKYNALVVSPGYDGARFAVAQDPNAPLEFGACVAADPWTSYWVTAVIKGKGYGQYVYSPFIQTLNQFDSADWIYYRGIVRTPSSGQMRGALFVDGGNAQLGYAAIDEWTDLQRAEYNDWIMSDFALDVPAATGTLAQRLALAPNALDKIVNGGTLKIACVGDSLMMDTCQSSWPELVMRTFPALTIQWQIWGINQTGATGWLAADKSSIYAWAPDLIYFGGISSDYDATQDWYDLVDAFRANIPGVELILGSKVRADAADVSGPKVQAIAAAKSCVFYPAAATYNSWLAPMVAEHGFSEGTIIRDGTHFNVPGWEVAGRCLAGFLGAEFP